MITPVSVGLEEPEYIPPPKRFAILLSITFSTVWTYQISYNFDLYNFEQPKNHYWKHLIDNLKSQNPNQPLLGWFVLLIGGSVLLSSMIFIFSIF